MLKKIIFIVILVTLFPFLLKLGFYIFVIFLVLSLLPLIAFFIFYHKSAKNMTIFIPTTQKTKVEPDSQNLTIDVKAERR